MEWVWLGVGLAILLVAGDALVKGAVNVALRVGIPALIVSLTVVAFGTSAPEMLVTLEAVLKGKPSLGLGNVVGSNTANVLLVLGVPALLATMHTSEHDTRRSYIIMMAASVGFVGLAMLGTLTLLSGLLLLSGLVWMLYDSVQEARNHRHEKAEARRNGTAEPEVEGADPRMRWWKILTYLAVGLVGLPVGAHLMIENAALIAERFGISEAVIGLTLVALGTSLPELATTVMAALRRQADVALGNVIGSNIFNILAIIGVASVVHPIPVDESFVRFDFWVMLAVSLLLVPFVFFKRDVTRIWGVLLTGGYVLYIITVLA